MWSTLTSSVVCILYELCVLQLNGDVSLHSYIAAVAYFYMQNFWFSEFLKIITTKIVIKTLVPMKDVFYTCVSSGQYLDTSVKEAT